MDKDELIEWVEEYFEAWQAQDPDRVLDLISKDSIEYNFSPFEPPKHLGARFTSSGRTYPTIKKI